MIMNQCRALHIMEVTPLWVNFGWNTSELIFGALLDGPNRPH
jgi:hypothetical protein